MPQNKMFVVGNRYRTSLYCTIMDSGSVEGLPLLNNLESPQFTDGWYMKDGSGVPALTTRIKFPTVNLPTSKEGSDITSNLTIHRVKFSTAAIGTYNLKVGKTRL